VSTQKLPAEVRAAFDRLDTLDVLPTDQHVEVFEDMNRRLAEALADLDGSGTGAVASERAAGAGAKPPADPPRPGPGVVRPTR
jgi:hypothetical protein